ncbi:MAG: alpha/beta hydrolase [Alphaproteobacteria bacterium]
MAHPVYLHYDRDALHAQYNNRGKVPDFTVYGKAWTERTEAFHARKPKAHFDVAYGSGPRQRLDIYLPDGKDAPLLAWIHGGYWQWNDKEPLGFLAEPFLAAGIAFANIEYTLCPQTDFAGLVGDVRNALAFLWREAGRYGYRRDAMTVSGHSAGGHLTATMAATDWPDVGADLPSDLVAGAVPVSGIFDLEPIRHTPIGDPLGLDAGLAVAWSPMFMPARTGARLAIAVGGTEGPEFHRQAEEFATHWRGYGHEAKVLSLSGENHFSIVEKVAAADSALHHALRRLIGR